MIKRAHHLIGSAVQRRLQRALQETPGRMAAREQAIAARGRRDPLGVDALRLAVRIAQEDEGLRPGHVATAYTARVEHGRWIADCVCRAGLVVDPEWLEAGCLGCGRWGPLVVPEFWRQIEAVLDQRPLREHQNWFPAESLQALADENAAHGLPRGL